MYLHKRKSRLKTMMTEKDQTINACEGSCGCSSIDDATDEQETPEMSAVEKLSASCFNNAKKRNAFHMPKIRIRKEVKQTKATEVQEEGEEYSAKKENAQTEAQTLDKELDEKYALQEFRDNARNNRRKKAGKLLRIFFLVVSVYSVFLIYGVFTTDYQQSATGNLIAERTTVEAIAAQKEYTKMMAQYLQARTIYEEVLLLDYRVTVGMEDPLLLSSEYENVLGEINVLVIQMKAITPSNKYTQTYALLSTWTSTDIAVYCQNMSAALSSAESADSIQHAEEYKTLAYNDFAQITQNFIKLGENVPGVNKDEIQNWSPETYVRQKTGTV